MVATYLFIAENCIIAGVLARTYCESFPIRPFCLIGMLCVGCMLIVLGAHKPVEPALVYLTIGCSSIAIGAGVIHLRHFGRLHRAAQRDMEYPAITLLSPPATRTSVRRDAEIVMLASRRKTPDPRHPPPPTPPQAA